MNFVVVGAVVVPKKEFSVLFIGNSFTKANRMPQKFKKLAKRNNIKVRVGKVVHGSATWSAHVQLYGAIEKILERNWTVVIFQEQSQFLSYTSNFYSVQSLPFIRSLNDAVQTLNNSTTLLYETFAYKYGNGEQDTYDKMQCRILKGYTTISKLLHGRVEISYVGEEWKKKVSTIELYKSDGKHPNKNGSWIIAKTLFNSFYNIINKN